MEKEKLVALVTAAQNGDSNATNELFNAYYNDLYYFALKTIKDDDLALDITQEAFVEIINTIDNLKEPAAFVTWAKQITYHQCTRYFKKKKDVLVDEDEDGNTVFDTLKEENVEFIPDEALDKTDFKKTVMGILDELSEEQRSAVMMYYFDEMSVHQIAEIQGVSEGTIKSRLNYARKTIKMAVEDYEKKNNIKLHSFGMLPLFKWIFNGAFDGALPTASAEIIAEGVTAATGTTVAATSTAATGVTAATVTTTTTAATATGIGAKLAAIPLATKIIAATVAATVVVGGTTTAVVLTNNETTHDDAQSVISAVVDENVNSTVIDINTEEQTSDELILEGVIPEGCTYTLTDGTVLVEGDNFPENCNPGDVVTYGDYLYGYECVYMGYEEDVETDWYLWKDGFDSGDSGLIESDVFGAWSVVVSDRSKTSYGQVASKINGQPIKSLYATYFSCKNMTEAPKIPSTIKAMIASYYGCSALKSAPVIPANVERIMLAFRDCTLLTGNVVINATLDKSLEWFYTDTFSGTKGNINLVGATPENDLILIAQASDNANITVNGKVLMGSGGLEEDFADEETPVEDDTPSQEDVIEQDDVFSSVKPLATDYVGRLKFSMLPNFTTVNELSVSNAFWFVFYGIDINRYHKDTSADGAISYYEIPASVITSASNIVFGMDYDFSSLYEYDPYAGVYQAGYTPVNGGEDVFIVTAQGGAGDPYHPEVKGYTNLGNGKYQVDIAWYDVSSEKPADPNADYFLSENGDYWIADEWEVMILEQNGSDSQFKIVSYTKK